MRALTAVTVLALIAAAALVFGYAPQDEVEGLRQKIFYVHVPMALVALGGFVAGGVFAVQHLRTRDRAWDLRSYVAIHLSLVLAIGVLVTGAVWAKAAWGQWWVWDEPMLVSFLIVFLLYATYQPLRFSIEDPDRQARSASVFAIVAGAFVPVCFAAVRMAEAYIHPRTFDSTDNLPGPMALTFAVSLLAMTLLFATLWRWEMAAKRTRGRAAALRRRLDAVPTRPRRSAAPQVGA